MDYLKDYAIRLAQWLTDNPDGQKRLLDAKISAKTLQEVLEARCLPTTLGNIVGKIEEVTDIKIGDFLLRSAKMELWRGVDKVPQITSLERLFAAVAALTKEHGRRAVARWCGLDEERIRRYTGLKGRPNRMIQFESLKALLICVADENKPAPVLDSRVATITSVKLARNHDKRTEADDSIQVVQTSMVVAPQSEVVPQVGPDLSTAQQPTRATKRVRDKTSRQAVSQDVAPPVERGVISLVPPVVPGNDAAVQPEVAPSEMLRVVITNTMNHIELALQTLQEIAQAQPFSEADGLRWRKAVLRGFKVFGMELELELLKAHEQKRPLLTVGDMQEMTKVKGR